MSREEFNSLKPYETDLMYDVWKQREKRQNLRFGLIASRVDNNVAALAGATINRKPGDYFGYKTPTQDTGSMLAILKAAFPPSNG